MCLIIFKKYTISLHIFLYILEEKKLKKGRLKMNFPKKTETFINLGFIYLINVV